MVTVNSGVGTRVSVDWLSFSLPVSFVSDSEYEYSHKVRGVVNRLFPELGIGLTPVDKGRKPYSNSFSLDVGGMVYFSLGMGHVTVEVTGRGCQTLQYRSEFDSVARVALEYATNITRIDVAVDYETDIHPSEFARARDGRITTTGSNSSDTGVTEYVGSPKSPRQARVYRYYEPHPRAHLLRVEMVYRKRGGARQALEMYLNDGAEKTAAAMGKTFGWKHHLWGFENPKK